MGAFLGFIQAVLGAADNDVDLVGNVVAQHLVQAQCAGDAVDNRHHIGAEGGLQLGVLVQVVEHHARHSVTT